MRGAEGGQGEQADHRGLDPLRTTGVVVICRAMWTNRSSIWMRSLSVLGRVAAVRRPLRIASSTVPRPRTPYESVKCCGWISGLQKKIKNNPDCDPNKSEILPLYKEFPGQVAGRSVSRGDYAVDGMHAKVVDQDWVQVRLIYKEGLHPPFIVLTAMPHKAP